VLLSGTDSNAIEALDTNLKHIQMRIDPALYLKDPESSVTGQALVHEAARMIATEGMDAFTLKKLSTAAGFTEATVYRYFGNKHQLLMYLLNLYWSWLLYHASLATANVGDPEMRIRKLASLLSEPISGPVDDLISGHLYAIALNESVKAHLSRNADADWRMGMFQGYSGILQTVASCIRELCPNYAFPMAWAATFVDAAMQQQFFCRYLPHLTEVGGSNATLDNFLMALIPQTHCADNG
jgi:AcrR family transcriptional regulator